MYQVCIEDVLGLKVRGNLMEINPVIPESWPRLNLKFRNGETIYKYPFQSATGESKGFVQVAGRVSELH